jgi:hypothetical protein
MPGRPFDWQNSVVASCKPTVRDYLMALVRVPMFLGISSCLDAGQVMLARNIATARGLLCIRFCLDGSPSRPTNMTPILRRIRLCFSRFVTATRVTSGTACAQANNIRFQETTYSETDPSSVLWGCGKNGGGPEVLCSYMFRKGRPLPPEPTEGTAIQSLEVLPWATSLITTEENKGEPAG